MKILILDDDHNRLAKARSYFLGSGSHHVHSEGHTLYQAETAAQAIKILDLQSPFDLVSLDHDLGGNVFCPSDEQSGYAVAEHILTLAPEKLPGRIVVHSFNPVGASNMMACLEPLTRRKDFRVEVLRIPFNL